MKKGLEGKLDFNHHYGNHFSWPSDSSSGASSESNSQGKFTWIPWADRDWAADALYRPFTSGRGTSPWNGQGTGELSSKGMEVSPGPWHRARLWDTGTALPRETSLAPLQLVPSLQKALFTQGRFIYSLRSACII